MVSHESPDLTPEAGDPYPVDATQLANDAVHWVESGEKSVVAAATAVVSVGGVILSMHFLHGAAEALVTGAVAVAGTILSKIAVYQKRNSRKLVAGNR